VHPHKKLTTSVPQSPPNLHCTEFIQQQGRDNVTADDVVQFVKPEGRAAVPDSVKADLLMQIKTFMVQL